MTFTESAGRPLDIRRTLRVADRQYDYFRILSLQEQGFGDVCRLPRSVRILLEGLARRCDGKQITVEDVAALAAWQPQSERRELPFFPARVLLQDFTGVPALVDLAAMRDTVVRRGGDPQRVNPEIPVELVIDHSVVVNRFASPGALEENMRQEFQRNRERYAFLRWGQKAFDNFRVIPPGIGIVHQVNLEYLARAVMVRRQNGRPVALPDTLVGTDSHTTMINGLGILAWGVGGIEAEAAMLGGAVPLLAPEVIGVELSGSPAAGVTATDIVLTVTEMLRRYGVVGKFVEFFGPAVAAMTVPDRATIANMAPEYGATVGLFPIDQATLDYLRLTGRDEHQIELVERYYKEQGLFGSHGGTELLYNDVLSLDLSTVEASIAGPKRPQDRIPLSATKSSFEAALTAPKDKRGFGLTEEQLDRQQTVKINKEPVRLRHGSVTLAAITSCTNTSNPSVMIAAGLLARNAVRRGLKVPPYVKTSLAPGSRVVDDYLRAAGLMEPLEKLGFHTVGYGCTSCIGNSGPLPEPIAAAITEADLVTASVLSGNRNFEGRVNPLIKANYLASPPLVVAFALAGTVGIDPTTEPLGCDVEGRPVYLREIWPDPEEIARTMEQSLTAEMFQNRYAPQGQVSQMWEEIPVSEEALFPWSDESTYIRNPPFFELSEGAGPVESIRSARVLALLGDSVTTDHISPAGSIPSDGPAGKYLIAHGVEPVEFNSLGSRRGNDQVMVRGTLANVRLRNKLAPGTEGGWTAHQPDGEVMTIFDAAERYREEKVPLVILAGAEYGTGSSRDWAAKGVALLGVRVVLAVSFERIHRSNLIGMGVLPLQFINGQTAETLGLSGRETYDIELSESTLVPGGQVTVTATDEAGNAKSFSAKVRIDTPVELEYYRHGGILPATVERILAEDA